MTLLDMAGPALPPTTVPSALADAYGTYGMSYTVRPCITLTPAHPQRYTHHPDSQGYSMTLSACPRRTSPKRCSSVSGARPRRHAVVMGCSTSPPRQNAAASPRAPRCNAVLSESFCTVSAPQLKIRTRSADRVAAEATSVTTVAARARPCRSSRVDDCGAVLAVDVDTST
jgi:hypothetical protein